MMWENLPQPPPPPCGLDRAVEGSGPVDVRAGDVEHPGDEVGTGQRGGTAKIGSVVYGSRPELDEPNLSWYESV